MSSFNESVRFKIGGKTILDRHSFTISYHKNNKGIVDFTLRVKNFKSFRSYEQEDSQVKVYVMLEKDKDVARYRCGSIQKFEETKIIKSEDIEQTNKSLIMLSEVPDVAIVQYLTSQGKILCEWRHNSTQITREHTPKDEKGGKGRREMTIVEHNLDPEDKINIVSSYDFADDDATGKIEIKWNQIYNYQNFTDRERLLFSSYFVNEILNYFLINSLIRKDGDEYEEPYGDDVSIYANVKRFILDLDGKALENLVNKGDNSTLNIQRIQEWKEELIHRYTKKQKLLSELKLDVDKKEGKEGDNI